MADQNEPQVAVWNYASQMFISHIDCPGEQRVRVDYHGDLSDLDVFSVERREKGMFVVNTRPLSGWRIDLS